MTLHEIEETLHDLQSRHPGLSETLLVTLLRSGGWEEKNIQEALFLFRGGGAERTEDASATTMADALPSLETESILPPPADENHMLMEHNDEILPLKEEQIHVEEPQSLVKESVESVPDKKDELPHNLPLRPFETSEHIWPFARYKDVFYGEVLPETEAKEEKKIEVLQERVVMKEEARTAPQAVAPPVETHTGREPVVAYEKEAVLTPSPIESQSTPVVVHFTRDDGKMVIMACIMLLAILLLLGYMYSNGRL